MVKSYKPKPHGSTTTRRNSEHWILISGFTSFHLWMSAYICMRVCMRVHMCECVCVWEFCVYCKRLTGCYICIAAYIFLTSNQASGAAQKSQWPNSISKWIKYVYIRIECVRNWIRHAWHWDIQLYELQRKASCVSRCMRAYTELNWIHIYIYI